MPFARVAPVAAEEMGKSVLSVDDDVESEVYANLWRHKRLLPPLASDAAVSMWQRRWGLLLTLCALHDLIFVPFCLCFRQGRSAAVVYVSLGWVVDLAAAVDIFLTFRTTYRTEDNELESSLSAIARRYRHGPLALDVLATLPFDLCAAYRGITSTAFWACRLNRLLRIRRGCRPLSPCRVAAPVASMPPRLPQPGSCTGMRCLPSRPGTHPCRTMLFRVAPHSHSPIAVMCVGCCVAVWRCAAYGRLLLSMCAGPSAGVHTVHAAQIARMRRTLRLGVFWVVWLLLAHWCACIWWALGTAPFNADDARRLPWLRRVPHRGTPLSEDSPLAQS